MILLPHAKRIAHDSGRGMGLPGLYSGLFLMCPSTRPIARPTSPDGAGGDMAVVWEAC